VSVQGLGAFEPGDLEINGKRLAGDLLDIVTDAEPIRTISGASTVTLICDDPDGWIRKSGLYLPTPGHRTDLKLDGLWFRSCAFKKTGTTYNWQFEARAAAELRERKSPKRAVRGHSTLAQFLRSCVREIPSIGFVSPELNVKEPIAKRTQAEKQSTRDIERSKGIAYGADITIKGVKATKAQIDLLNRSLAVAESHGAASGRAGIALIIAEIDESEVHNYEHFTEGSGDSLGILQYRVSLFGRAKATDVEWSVANFLTKGSTGAGGAIAVALKNPGMTPAEITSINQGNRDGASVYAPYEAEAKKILDAYGSGIQNPEPEDGFTYVKQYVYSRGEPTGPKKEDTWACGTRYAEALKWRWFEVANYIYWVSDFDLIRSRPRLTLNEHGAGVLNIDFSLDTSEKKPDTMTVDCLMAQWGAPPGTVVDVTQDMGPAAAGAWIVSEISKPSLGLLKGTVILTRPQAPNPEPAATVVQRPASSAPESTTPISPGTPAVEAKLAREHPELKEGVRKVVAIILAQYPKLQITSTTGGNHVSGSLHYQGRAADLAGPDMDAIGTWIGQNLSTQLTEGIHNPTLAVKDGKFVNGPAFYAAVWEGHKDHIHIGV
jgi:hypothetical protein